MYFDLKHRCCSSAFFVFVGMLTFTGLAAAQRGGAQNQATSGLTPAEGAVISRLASLGTLSGGPWKMHPGDVPHGEAVNMDDSDWQTARVGAQSPGEAVWFRRSIEVPETLHGYDLTGARIWFQFRDTAHGPITQIIYINGRRVAMGEDLEPIMLFDDAHPGERAVVAVKLLDSVGTKTFQGATMKIDFAENRPNPDDLRQEFLSVAVLLPSLTPGDRGKRAVLENAIESVDVGALDTSAAGDAETRTRAQTIFDLSLKAAQGKLDALRPRLQDTTYHLTGNSHIDAAWLWSWTETVDVVRRTFGTALQLMNEYPGYTYTQSAAQYNKWMADKYPELN